VTTDYCPTCGYRVVTDLIRALEEGTADVAAEEAKAAAVMQRFYAKRPEFGPGIRAPGAAITAAVQAVWGPHGR
jgi:hypothetical protein